MDSHPLGRLWQKFLNICELWDSQERDPTRQAA